MLGGLHVTALAQEALQHADAVVVGEGELSWPEVISDVLSSGTPRRRIYDGRGRSFDLAHAPVPRHDLLEIERYNRLTVQTQRDVRFGVNFVRLRS